MSAPKIMHNHANQSLCRNLIVTLYILLPSCTSLAPALGGSDGVPDISLVKLQRAEIQFWRHIPIKAVHGKARFDKHTHEVDVYGESEVLYQDGLELKARDDGSVLIDGGKFRITNAYGSYIIDNEGNVIDGFIRNFE